MRHEKDIEVGRVYIHTKDDDDDIHKAEDPDFIGFLERPFLRCSVSTDEEIEETVPATRVKLVIQCIVVWAP